MKIIYFIFYSFFILVLLAIASLFVVPLLPIDNNIQIKIVESGSMEPNIKTGSLVVIRPLDSYKKGDVITFNSVSADVPTTHRILEVRGDGQEKFFMTKGDANEDPDSVEASLRSVIGKVVLSVPYIGFILDFARQPIGFGLLIVLPALMIILGEIEKIWKEIRNKKRNNKSQDDDTDISQEPPVYVRNRDTVRMMEIACPVYLEQYVPTATFKTTTTGRGSVSLKEYILPSIIILVSIAFSATGFIGDTVSYFNDIESSLQNRLAATLLDFKAESEGPAYTFADAFDSVTISTTLSPEEDSLLVDYELRVEKIEGGVFCDALLAEAGTPVVYTGPLLSLIATGVVLNQTWDVQLGLDPLITNYLPQEVCVADLVFTAWYKDGETGAGYSDEEKVRLTLTTPNTTPAPLIEQFRTTVVEDESTSPLLEGEDPVLPPPPEDTTSSPENIVPQDPILPVEDTNGETEGSKPELKIEPESKPETPPIEPETPKNPTI